MRRGAGLAERRLPHRCLQGTDQCKGAQFPCADVGRLRISNKKVGVKWGATENLGTRSLLFLSALPMWSPGHYPHAIARMPERFFSGETKRKASIARICWNWCGFPVLTTCSVGGTLPQRKFGALPPQEIDTGMGAGRTHTPLLLGMILKLDLTKEKEAIQNIR